MKSKVFAGAPPYNQVLCESTWTVDSFFSAFSFILPGAEWPSSLPERTPQPAWRLLTSEDLHTGFTQHSFLLHTPLAYDFDTPHSSVDLGTPSECDDDESSFLSTFLSSSPPPSPSPVKATHATPVLHPRAARQITSLNTIPTATRLTFLLPQTITLDAVVGIISVAAERRVAVRRGSAEVDLVEAIVGDDTRAGLRIAFWLDVGQQHGQAKELRDELASCAPGDVVLLRNVALGVFRGVVCGASMRRRWWRTEVVRLGRAGEIPERARRVAQRFAATAGSEHIPVQGANQTAVWQRATSVADWARRFVGREDDRRQQKRIRGERQEEIATQRKNLRLSGSGSLPADETPVR